MRVLPLVLIVVATPLAVTTAQVGAPASRPVPDTGALTRLQARLEGRSRVRVARSVAAAPYLAWVELRQPVLDRTGVRSGDGSTVVPWPEVSRLQVRASAFGRGLVYGAVIGGSVGLLLGAAGTRQCTGGWFEWCGADAGDVVALTAGTALVSSLLGGLIAAPVGRWSTVYRAAPPRMPAISLRPARGARAAVIASVAF
ncbi:MAG TPA: hypothetical protein VFH97_00485 [Gemmatimonadales bacterium]|nr:hypothetical protein [Gemmatimonadales bacterium]